MKMSVVVVTKNESKTLPDLLTALDKQTLRPAEVILVDDYSTDGMWETLQATKNQYHFPIISAQQMSNRSQARNLGVSLATTEFIAMTDAGCIPDVNWLEELVSTVPATQQPIIVAGWTEGSPQNSFEQAVVTYTLPSKKNIDPQSFLPATRSIFFNKDAWLLVGKFDEQLNEGEDFAFARKAAHLPSVLMKANLQAIVRWRPRTSIFSFAKMVYLYARGDAKAGSWRPKVIAIYARYLVVLLLMAFGMNWIWLAIGLVIYSLWAVYKNAQRAHQGWVWLPCLQLVSDVAVMTGTGAGLVSKWRNLFGLHPNST